jgi:hypothetical protein
MVGNLMKIAAKFLSVLLVAGLSLLNSCATSNPAEKIARDAAIRAEAPGNYYIGRRYHTNGCRFWGYLRRPGQQWEQAKLVVMHERSVKQPDRLLESPESGPAHGYDHNREYRVFGNFTGAKTYDPNADLELDTFAPTKFELINPAPGFLFDPRDRYDPRYLPKRASDLRGY